MKSHNTQAMLSLLIILLFSFQNLFAQTSVEPLSRTNLDNRIVRHLQETNKVYHWSEADDHMIWSALVHSNGMASIGYRPSSLVKEIPLEKINIHAAEWTAARQKIIQKVVDGLQAKGIVKPMAELMPRGEFHQLPYINIRIQDLDIVKDIRSMPEVTYLEPMDFNLESYFRSGEGCTTPPATPVTLNTADYTAISPNAISSWHHAEHNIRQAWTNSTAGAGIGIAVIDTGLSSSQEKMNGQFTEGQSGGRTVTKKGFYDPNGGSNYDGWNDQCGHGTSMTSIATAPRGNNGTATGVAYRANLHSYRGTNDVIIGSGNEKDGVCSSLMDIANNSNIHIVSMSIGDVFYSTQVAACVKFAKSQGKLLFAAGGTSTTFTNWYGVIFPASMAECVAVTGINDALSLCDICHDGYQVDFAVCMQRANSGGSRNTVCLDRSGMTGGGQVFNHYVGGSSAATATMAGVAALVWGNNPSWNRLQVLQQLIESTGNYTNHLSTLGWGKVDANLAVMPPVPSTCNFATSNNVTVEITEIKFPAMSEGFGDFNEWVMDLNGNEYYFEVCENGACGSPGSMDNGTCGGALPLRLNFSTSCGQSTVPLTISSHENDSATNNCTDNFGDDDSYNNTLTLNLNSSTLSYNTGAGTFTLSYIVDCTPTSSGVTANITSPTTTLDCNTTSITLNASSSSTTGSASYSWSNGGSAATKNVTAPGNYCVTVTDNATGCADIDCITITENITAPIASITSNNTILTCNTTSVTLNASSSTTTGSASYSWTGGGSAATKNVTTPGNYCVTVTDNANGCTDVTCQAVTEDVQVPTATISASSTTACEGAGSVTIVFNGTNGSAPFTYTFTVNGGATQTNTTGTVSQSTAVAGAYTYTITSVTGGNGCSQNVSASITITVLPLSDPSCSACPPDYASGGNGDLTGNENGTSDYETNGPIESTQTIGGSASVDYDSQTSITLNAGFNTLNGAIFNAFIDGCNGGSGGVNLDDENDTEVAKKKKEPTTKEATNKIKSDN